MIELTKDEEEYILFLHDSKYHHMEITNHSLGLYSTDTVIMKTCGHLCARECPRCCRCRNLPRCIICSENYRNAR